MVTKKKKARKRAGAAGSDRALLEGLSGEEGREVLLRLVEGREDLTGEAAGVARALLGEVSFREVAGDLLDAFAGLDVRDLAGRSGKMPWGGYVEAEEAAMDMLGETLRPFLERMDRYRQVGRHDAAGEVLRGIIVGLYQLEEAGNEVVECAVDFQGHALTWILDAWSKGPDGKRCRRGRPPLDREFLREHVPEWAGWLKG